MIEVKGFVGMVEAADAMVKAAKVTLVGYAQSNARVSTLMRNIESSPWLANPNLIEIKATAVLGNGADPGEVDEVAIAHRDVGVVNRHRGRILPAQHANGGRGHAQVRHAVLGRDLEEPIRIRPIGCALEHDQRGAQRHLQRQAQRRPHRRKPLNAGGADGSLNLRHSLRLYSVKK
mgnify:CR=1 FL=1